jgi:hypothetical protein
VGVFIGVRFNISFRSISKDVGKGFFMEIRFNISFHSISKDVEKGFFMGGNLRCVEMRGWLGHLGLTWKEFSPRSQVFCASDFTR